MSVAWRRCCRRASGVSQDHPLVGEARGVGLVGALELVEDKASKAPYAAARGVGAYVSKRCEAHGLIVRVIGGDIIALSPPLIIDAVEIEEMLARLERALDDTWAWLRGSM